MGQIDMPLDETGIYQANRLKDQLTGSGIEAIYCSDLIRSRHTAEIISEGHDIRIFVLKSLREIDLGEWEGCTFSDIQTRCPEEFKQRGADIVHYRVPGGESFSDCRDRVLAAFRTVVASSSGDIAIAGHSGVNRIILCYIMGVPLEEMFSIQQEYGEMSQVRL
ncbi:MAG TPA: histidine phosphatase family protein [Nitrospirota bacterium]|nr:histidine phosphatase family protein [Nitrospirota bacterium]